MGATTTARLAATDFSCRLDAEFFSASNRKLRAQIAKSCIAVSDVAEVSDGNHGSISEEYAASGHRYLRGTDLFSFFLDDAKPMFIDDATFNGLGRGYVEPGDVLLTIVGAGIGAVALAPAEHGVMAASCKLAILRARSIPPAVLAVLFTTRVGQALLRMTTRGSAQQGIPLEGLKRMQLPVVPERAWAPVTRLVAEAESMASRARRAYPEAEAEMLERFGWTGAAAGETAFARPLSTLGKAVRIDAEHFHPRQLRLERQLQRAGARSLGDVAVSNSKGAQPQYSETGTVMVVKSKDVSGGTVDLGECDRTDEATWDDNPQARLRERDLLVNSTGLGSLGRAAVVPALQKRRAIAAVDVTIWRLDLTQALPEYVSLFLNSPPGQMQSTRYQTGSSGQLHLYPDHIRRLLLFVPSNSDGAVDIAWQARLGKRLADGLLMAAGVHERLEKARALLTEAIGVLAP